jgi:hypothetical protein
MKTLKALLLVVCAAALLAAGAAACPSRDVNLFVSKCSFDLTRMRNQVDPIVQHGVKPSAHSHDFYGWIRPTELTVANSTLPAGTTSNPGYSPVVSTCGVYGDWPSYWFPTPNVGGIVAPNHTDTPTGRNVAAADMLATYRSPVGVQVLPPPYGMTYVAGNSHATSPAENPHLSWTCGSLNDGSAKPIDCTRGGAGDGGARVPRLLGPAPRLGPRTAGTRASPGSSTSTAPPASRPSTSRTRPPASAPPATCRSRSSSRARTSSTRLDNSPLQDPTGLAFSSGPYYTYHGDFLNVWSKFVQTLTLKCNDLIPGVVSVDCLTGLGATAEEATG